MIESKYLTKTYLETYAQNQIEKYLSVGKVDEELAEEHIKNAYKVAGLKVPKNIIWYDSPKSFVASVRDSVGASVRASVGASVRASVRDSVRASVRASVRDSVWASVWDSVRDSVWASVRDSVWASVRDSVWDSVGASVRASVRDSVGAYDNSAYDSWLKFFNDHQEENDFRHICMFDEMVTGYLLTADTVYIVRKPIFLSRGTNGRLDSDQRMAIEWADGYGFYYLKGVEFDKDLWQKTVDQKITLKDYVNIQNADLRPIVLQMLRPDRLLKQMGAKLINTGIKGTKLYAVENFSKKVDPGSDTTNDTEYCMLMTHPTIANKQYIEWVDPKVGVKADADLCQAVAFGIPKEDYLLALEA